MEADSRSGHAKWDKAAVTDTAWKGNEAARGRREDSGGLLCTNKARASLYEMLKFIDDEVPEEERFKAVKSVFLSSLLRDKDTKEREALYYLLGVCKQLSSMEVLILKACYERSEENKSKNITTGPHAHGEWVDDVAAYIGLGLPELVSASDEHLVRLGLISDRTHSDRSGVVASNYRLTNLGIRLCKEMLHHDT